MARLSLAITAVAAFLAAGFAAPTGTGKTAVVSLPFSRVKSSPNWKQAVTADKSRAAHFGKTSKVVKASASVTATNEEFSYVTSVTVGTQTFSLIVDTGKYTLNQLDYLHHNLTPRVEQAHPIPGLVLEPNMCLDPPPRTLVTPSPYPMEAVPSPERSTPIPLLWDHSLLPPNPSVMLHPQLDSQVLMALLVSGMYVDAIHIWNPC